MGYHYGDLVASIRALGVTVSSLRMEKIMRFHQFSIPALVLANLMAFPSFVTAFEASENDAFYLGYGSANIEVRDSTDLISGQNVLGGVRVGLFWTFFMEFGYGAVEYSDKVEIEGAKKKIEFRTTGPHVGIGLLIPIRKILWGIKYHTSPDNKWSEEVTDTSTKVINRTSGDIDFDSYFVFVRLFNNTFEFGIRRDLIKKTDSIVDNSFGPYFLLNIPFD